MTRNNHIDSKDAIKVKVESPAARNADGMIKLGDHKIGCAMADIKIIVKMVGIISSGGLNNFIINGKNGNKITDVITKRIEERPINDLINFFASCMSLRPIH